MELNGVQEPGKTNGEQEAMVPERINQTTFLPAAASETAESTET